MRAKLGRLLRKWANLIDPPFVLRITCDSHQFEAGLAKAHREFMELRDRV